MRILVLTSFRENTHHTLMNYMKNYVESPVEIFMLPLFADYLCETNIEGNIYTATYRSTNMLKTAFSSKDIVIFGNAEKSVKFDAIFSMPIEQEVYEDRIIETIAKTGDKEFYSVDDASFHLQNNRAALDFLIAYAQSDRMLTEEMKIKYEEVLKNVTLR